MTITKSSPVTAAVPVQEKIKDLLTLIEKEKGVDILYACESGSRAWGFESQDSDYDIRFIYKQEYDWYLSIDVDKKRNVIERTEGDLDFAGWELRKALNLYYKSNPPLLEWLGSPIVYKEYLPFINQLRGLVPKYYNPVSCQYHYLHMALGNYRQYLKGHEVWLKKYFYVLRPVMAVIWIEHGYGRVPTRFDELLRLIDPDGPIPNPKLGRAISHLLEMKIAGDELSYGPRDPVINEFLDNQLNRLREKRFRGGGPYRSRDELDNLFRNTVRVK